MILAGRNHGRIVNCNTFLSISSITHSISASCLPSHLITTLNHVQPLHSLTKQHTKQYYVVTQHT